MKKQTKKLSLNKKTISNLTTSEMNKYVGGSKSQDFCPGGGTGSGGANCSKACSQKANSCPGHNTCATCPGYATCYTC